MTGASAEVPVLAEVPVFVEVPVFEEVPVLAEVPASLELVSVAAWEAYQAQRVFLVHVSAQHQGPDANPHRQRPRPLKVSPESCKHFIW